MKKIQIIFSGTVIIILLLLAVSCDDLTEINTSPNEVNAEEIDLSYILTYAVSYPSFEYIKGQAFDGKGISEAMQYIQKDYIGYTGPNNFNWSSVSISNCYSSLENSQYIYNHADRASDENAQNFYKAAGLIMRSFWFGFFTSAWGDIPYTEALQAEAGNYTPGYDPQDEIFKGVLEDLETANDLLTNIGTVDDAADGDIMYQGDAAKWRKFANSLRLRYCLRLSEKQTEMSSTGVDVASVVSTILSNSSTYPVFTSNDDNASINYEGTDMYDSWPGGPLDWSNRSEFYRRKPCKTFVNALRDGMDPRLTTFIRPVDVQLLVRDDVAEGYEKLSNGLVKRYISTATFQSETEAPIDTCMYVGLPAAMKEPDYFNLSGTKNQTAISALDRDIYTDNAANPHVSYLADMYAENVNPLVKAVYMSYAEVSFLLAEARLKGWITSSNTADYYEQGIEASLDQYEIADGSKTVYNPANHETVAFDKSTFLSNLKTEFSNASTEDEQLNLLMTQKWLALFMTPEFWFDWRRTGLPDFGANVISGANGSKIPVRYIYGDDEHNYNSENVEEAVSRLDTGEDTQWAKMWLLQGTDNPW